MKEFRCAAVVPDCSARFEAESEAGILAQVVRHARDDHGMEHVPHDVLDEVRSHIVELE
jgi:predicted small metal-binding protein